MEKERKQGFSSALKGEVVRGLSPARSRGKSLAPRGPSSAQLLLPRSRKMPPPPPPLEQLGQYLPEPLVARSGSLCPLWKLYVQLDPVFPSFSSDFLLQNGELL